MSWHPSCFNEQFGTNENGSPTKYESRCQARAKCKYGGLIAMGQNYIWKRDPNDPRIRASSSSARADQNKKTLQEMMKDLKSKEQVEQHKEKNEDLKAAAENLNVTYVECIDNSDTGGQLLLDGIYTVDTSRWATPNDYLLVGVRDSWHKSRFKVLASPVSKPIKVLCIDSTSGEGQIVFGDTYIVDSIRSCSDNSYYLVGVKNAWSKTRFEIVRDPTDPVTQENLKDALKEAVEKASTTNEKDSTLKVDEALKAAEALKPILQKMVNAAVEKGLDRSKLVDELAMKVLDQVASVVTTTVEIKLPDGATHNVGAQHKQFPILLKAVAARCNVWLAGPSASGKTTAAENVAKALKLDFRFTGAVGDAYALLGYNDANGKYVRTQFREAWEKGGVFLWDEVDASDPNALLAFNAALANDVAPFPDGIIRKHPDCVLIAAANTFGHGATHDYVGRLKMDAAFLKRFAFLSWDIDEQLELATAPNKTWTKRVQEVRQKVKDKGLRVLVTPRESYIGARLLAAGISQSIVEQMTVRSGMTDSQWSDISHIPITATAMKWR